MLDLRRRHNRLVIFFMHTLLEAFDTLAKIAHHLGNAATAKQNQNDQRQHDQVRKGKTTHVTNSFAPHHRPRHA